MISVSGAVVLATVPHPLPTLPVWVQVSAMSLAAMFGAMLARSRNVPVFGTMFAGVLVGFGGGIVRDMMLGIEPAAIAEWYYLPFGLVLAVIGALGYKIFGKVGTMMLAVNAVMLGVLVTIGAQKALEYRTPWISAMLLGVVTASFGGLLADNMSGHQATIAKQAHWVGSALAVGSITFVLVSHVLSFWPSVVIGVAVTALLRFVSQFRNWPSPTWPGEARTASDD